MNTRSRATTRALYCWLILLAACAVQSAAAQEQPALERRTFTYNGDEREYFVAVPKRFDSARTYWLLVAAHGGGSDGQSFWLTSDLIAEVEATGFNAIVVSPSFDKSDPNVQQFPLLGEGEFLEALIDEIGTTYKVHPKILLTGYSRGGQFAHRFALYFPARVAACAPISAGSWTTPDGRLFMYGIGEVHEPEAFLSSPVMGSALAEAQERLFNRRVAEVAVLPAEPASKAVPFLVMCGSIDERYPISRSFAESLRDHGYNVETAWPRTRHGGRSAPEYAPEFEKYARNAIAFFSTVTERE